MAAGGWLWRGRAAHRAGPRSRRRPSCSGARMLALLSGRARPDKRYFCWIGLNASAMSTVTISRYLQSDDERIQPQRSQSAQRTHGDFLSGYCGTFNPLPILNHMIIPLPRLARSWLPALAGAGCPPGRDSLAWQALPLGLGPACMDRVRLCPGAGSGLDAALGGEIRDGRQDRPAHCGQKDPIPGQGLIVCPQACV